MPKWISGAPRPRTASRAAGGGGGDVALVIGQAEGAGPGVEQLRGRGAGFKLRLEEETRGVGGPVGQGLPGLGVRVHHRPRAEVVARRAAFHHVGGQGERSARETDERGAAQFLDGEADGLADGLEGLPGELGQSGDVRRGAHRVLEDRADTGDDVHPTPASLRGMTISEKKIPASTSWRRTGCSVISAASSGLRQESSMEIPWRASRYSGSERPAWRMNHTGRRVGLPPRYAVISGESDVAPVTSGWAAGRAWSMEGIS